LTIDELTIDNEIIKYIELINKYLQTMGEG